MCTGPSIKRSSNMASSKVNQAAAQGASGPFAVRLLTLMDALWACFTGFWCMRNYYVQNSDVLLSLDTYIYIQVN